jgi:hypothetical protein
MVIIDLGQQRADLRREGWKVALDRRPELHKVDTEITMCESVAHFIGGVPRHLVKRGSVFRMVVHDVAAGLPDHFQVSHHGVLYHLGLLEVSDSRNGVENMAAQVSDEPE